MKEQTLATLPSLAQPDATGGLPVVRLLALTLSSFVATANETVPAGLLPQIADGFQIPEALAGQWVTLCALGSGLGAIPLMLATRHRGRRSLLLSSIALFCVCNALTAFSTSYGLTLLARFIVGLATGLAWSLMAGCARRMVVPALQGRALALAMLGIPLALSLGVPLSAWLARLVEWRVIFGLLSGLSLLLLIWVRLGVPEVPAEQRVPRPALRQVLGTPGVRPVLLVVWMWIMAHYMLYTYIAPFLESVSPGTPLEQVLMVFGVSAMLGVWLVGVLVDRWLRPLVLISLTGFALVALGLGLRGTSPVMLYAGVALWGLSFSGAPTLLQTALADAAGDGAEAAQAMLVTVFNLAYAAGGLLGAVVLETLGGAALPRALVIWLLAGLLVAWQARRHAFPPGRRVT